jgi:hypothetical protein
MLVEYGYLSTELCTKGGEYNLERDKSSGILGCVSCCMVTHISGKNSSPFSKVKQSKEVAGL